MHKNVLSLLNGCCVLMDRTKKILDRELVYLNGDAFESGLLGEEGFVDLAKIYGIAMFSTEVVTDGGKIPAKAGEYEFELYKVNDDGSFGGLADICPTGLGGTVAAKDLDPGFYAFKEIVPAGWTNNYPGGLFFEIRYTGETVYDTIWLLVEKLDESGNPTVVNRRRYDKPKVS